MFLFKKNKELLAKLETYLKLASNALNVFSDAIDYALKTGLDEHFEVLARKAHQEESNADDIRREIESEMYKKSLLPESREDLLEIIELIDKIPNRVDSILNMLITQNTAIFSPLEKDIRELVRLSLETFNYTVEATLDCFGSMKKIKELSRLVDNNESLGDRLERKIIRRIFEEEMDTGKKLVQKEITLELGAICDLCENVIDRIVICSIKRQV